MLYVDDAPLDQRILREAIRLARVPIELISADTAESANELLAKETGFRAVLLDWNLPTSVARDFLKTLKTSQPKLPVIVVTGELRTVDCNDAFQLGVDLVLEKPVKLRDWEHFAAQLYAHCEQ